jgi:hypothetical protein
MPRAVELLRGGGVAMRAEQIHLREGMYTFVGQGRSEHVSRDDVGDAFVLDALVIAPTDAVMRPIGERPA